MTIQTNSIRNDISAAEYGEYIHAERTRLLSRRSHTGVELMHSLSDLMDGVISRVLDQAKGETEVELGVIRGDMLEGVAVAATGGYGRRELCPHSDIDITFIVGDDDDPQMDLLVKRTYRLLMDVLLNGAGLRVGYSYRQLNDSRDLPLDVQTALLDARLIVGGSHLFERFYTGMLKSIVPASFVSGHIAQRKISTAAHGNSPYRIEPNIKEGAGGFRDLQTARWIAQLALGAPREAIWETLRAQGTVTDQDIKRIHAATEYLAKVRSALHVAADRGIDVLSIDRQEQIAELLGITQGAGSLMEKYFLHVERVFGIYNKVIEACHDQALEIEPGLVSQRGEIRLRDRGLFVRDPEAVIRVFKHAVELNLRVGREISDLIREFVSPPNSSVVARQRRPSARVLREFVTLLSLPGCSKALEDMTRVGVLQWLVPEFGRLMHLVPGDAAHELTVGAHSLNMVTQLESFRESDDSLLREAYASVVKPEILYVAALLHDSGKAEDQGPHAAVGAKIAVSVCRRLGLRQDESSQIQFLIANHLLMSETARLRDLNQSRTVEDFVSKIDSVELLDMLYMLTVADVRSVGQETWREVHMTFLNELYQRSAVVLQGSLPTQFDLDKHRGRLVRELSLTNLPADEIDEHCRAMPAAYLLNTSPDDLAMHIGYVRNARKGKPIVRLAEDPSGRFTEITICTLDDSCPGLLAKIAGVLAALDVEIHAAQVFTRESTDRIAIDSLIVDYNRRPLMGVKRLQVQSELEHALSGQSEVASLFSRFGKKLKREVSLVNLKVMSNVSDQHTVIEIEAEDQPGLLYRLTSTISSLGWDIHSARVGTWGTRGHDAFYVTDSTGAKLDGSAHAQLRKTITGE